MILKAITIENFKGIREPVRVELKPVTLLFGANSAGKSTVVQALHFAQEIFERHNVDPGRTLIGGEAINLGGFETLVHGHDRNRPIVLRLDLDLTETSLPTYRLPYVTSHSDFVVEVRQPISTGWVEVKIEWSELLSAPILKEYSVGFNDRPFATVKASSDLKQIQLNNIAYSHQIFWDEEMSGSDLFELSLVILNNSNFESIKNSIGLMGHRDALPVFGRPLELQEEVFEEEVPPPEKREFIETLSSLIVGPGELVRDALRSFRYLGPLRDVPPRNFDAERSPDESRWAHGLGAWDALFRADPTFINRVNEWLEEEKHLNSGYRVELKRYKELDVESPLFLALRHGWTVDEEMSLEEALESLPVRSRLLIREIQKGVEVQPQDVGVGISQLLPVIVAALHTSRGIVAIEQPELHIHPAWQVVLGDLFLEQAKNKDVLYLLETHSEHLVLRIMRRMRETFTDTLPPGAPAATPEDVTLLYVEANDGHTLVRNMPLNEAGELVKAWPGGFFEERLSELF